MTRLEHMLCAPCYQDKHPGKQPHELVTSVRHTCCCCGEMTANIPYRAEPVGLQCGGVRGLHETYK